MYRSFITGWIRKAVQPRTVAKNILQTHGFDRRGFSTGLLQGRAKRQGIVFTTSAILTALGAAYITQGQLKTTVLCEEPHALSNDGARVLAYEEVQKHNLPDDCWVIINGMVYDVTDFLEAHPGGQQAILLQAGKDASGLFSLLHPPNALEMLPPQAIIGVIDPLTLPEVDEDQDVQSVDPEQVPPVHRMLLLQDFEHWAQKLLSDTAWAYYRSAADEEKTFDENRNAFQRYFLRPRILCGLEEGSLQTELLGSQSSMPVFISPAALAKLGHERGELNLTEAAGECGVVQIVSANASCSIEELFAARTPGQNLVYQIYLNRDRAASEKLLQKVDKLGASAVVFTVDVGWESKRTLDVRVKTANMPPPIRSSGAQEQKSSDTSKSVSQQISGYQDRNLSWEDIPFIRRNTSLPLIVKGVQCVEDVARCAEYGVDGVIISNHGGRQCDYAPAPIDILYELRCLRPDLLSRINIYIDGGVRSGADIIKALALGAKGVGIGRPVMYANGTHGKDGVKRVLQILEEEMTNTMRNMGVARVQDLKPEMVGPRGPWVGWNRPPYMPVP